MATTTHADITRLETAQRVDREAVRREVEDRLATPGGPAEMVHRLRFIRGTIAIDRAEFGPALDDLRAVLEWAEANHDAPLAGRVQNALGLASWRLGDLPRALEHFGAGQQIGRAIGDHTLRLRGLANQALIYAAQKRWEEAERNFRLVWEGLRPEGSDAGFLAMTLNNLAFVLWERDGPTDAALAVAREALAAKLPLRDPISICQTANNIVGLLRDRGEFEAAHEALEVATQWVAQANARPPAFYHALNRGTLLLALKNPRRDDEHGFAAMQDALRIAGEAALLEEEARVHEYLAQAWADRGRHDAAYAHLRTHTQLREKYLTGQTAQRIDQLRHGFEIRRLEREHQDERQRREELEKLNGRLELVGRERDALLRVIGHDLRTHVGGMIGLADLIREALDPGGGADEFVADLVAAGESTLALLEEILSHGSALGGAFESVAAFDLGASLQDLRRRLGSLFARKRQTLTLDLPVTGVEATLNRSGLCRILENLLTNASKFSPRESEVTLRLSGSRARWRVEVIDCGPGVPAGEVGHLFEAPRRVSVRPTGGESSSGIGLLLARDLAHKLGVRLGYAPTPGGGSTFVISYPPT